MFWGNGENYIFSVFDVIQNEGIKSNIFLFQKMSKICYKMRLDQLVR